MLGDGTQMKSVFRKRAKTLETLIAIVAAVFLLTACTADKQADDIRGAAPENKMGNAEQDIAATNSKVSSAESAPVASFDVDKTYKQSCTFCHQAGVSLAPKTHDVAAWEQRKAKGMDVLLASVNKGMGAMPPKGMCATCTDDQFEALIEYMAAQAQ